jgi:hypothetical protein
VPIFEKIWFEEETETMYSVHCISQKIVVHHGKKGSDLPWRLAPST